MQGSVKVLLTTTDIFSRRDATITGFSAEGSEVRVSAANLHAQLDRCSAVRWRGRASTPTPPDLRIGSMIRP